MDAARRIGPERIRRHVLLGTLLAAIALGCAGCSDVLLVTYRDAGQVKDYKYVLGEQYLEVGGIKYCYQEFGEGETVLILPGLGTSIDFWQEAIPVLATQYHVVAVDPPGIGKSDKPDASYELSWMVDRLTEFMDAKGLGRVSVVGGSLGGHLALLLALNHPERVSKLVLMGSVGDWPTPTGFLDFALKNLWNEWMCIDYVRTQWPTIYGKMFKHPRPLTDRIYKYQMALRADGWTYYSEGRAFVRAFHSIFYNSVRDRLGEIRCPVLLVWGEQDNIHPAEAGVYLQDHIRDSELLVVKDSYHEVMIDQPALFDKILLRFLKEGTHRSH